MSCHNRFSKENLGHGIKRLRTTDLEPNFCSVTGGNLWISRLFVWKCIHRKKKMDIIEKALASLLQSETKML